MKVKKNYVLREIADQIVVVPIEEEAVKFNGIISLNKTGKVLWEKLKEEVTEDDLVNYLCSIYDVLEEKAKKDVAQFVSVLKEKHLLE